jgi:kinesin family protein 4/21/27
VRWNEKDQFVVENLFLYECETEEEALALYHSGIKNKIVSQSQINHASSRSHSVFSI